MIQQPRQPRLSFTLPLDAARLLRARHRIADYLHEHAVSPTDVGDVILAVEEAMTNAVRHGGRDGDVEVRLGFEGGDVWAEVRDHGVGFDVAAFDPGRVPDVHRPGGRGLYLMAQLMDELVLESHGGTDVRMVKRGVREGSRVPLPLAAVPDGEDLRAAPGYRQERERLLIEEVPEGFAALDWQYDFTYVNSRGLAFVARSPEQVLGHNLWGLFPFIAHTPLARVFRDAMEFGLPSIIEHKPRPQDHWYEFRVYPTSSGVSIYMRDIEERKRKELAHEESRRRAELLAETSARLLSAEEPQRIVEGLCSKVMEHLGCHVFFNYLADDAAGCLVLNAYAGIGVEDARRIELLDYGVAVCGCAAQRAERIVAEDIQHSDDERAGLVRSFGVQAYAAHPLMARGKAIGTLSFGTRDRVRFTDDELELMKTVADHVAIAIDRQRQDAALRASEAKYRRLFESMDEGFCVIEVLFDGAGAAVDYRFLETNPAFVEHTGISDAVGHRVREFLPGLESRWLEAYGRVALTGRPERLEQAAESLGRSYRVAAFRVGEPAEHKVAVFFKEIGAREPAAG